MWSDLGFSFIYARHPPLLPWLVGLVGIVVPVNWITLNVLAALNITMALFAIYNIARLTIGERRFPLVVIFFLISPYTLWFAVKLDHNSILLTAWSLFVWAFLLALREPNLRRGMVLGLAAAVALYAKYISLMLLASALFAALASSRREAFFKSSAPYVAIGVCAALFAPHAWQAYFSDNLSNVKFALQPLGEVGSLPKHMLWNNFINTVPVAIAFAVLYVRRGRAQEKV